MTTAIDELVALLSKPGPVICSRPERSIDALRECIDRNYVHLLFADTGTELGIQLFRPECDISPAAPGGEGSLRLVGGVTLNYQKVRCVATIDPATCEGTGYLVPVDQVEYNRIMS